MAASNSSATGVLNDLRSLLLMRDQNRLKIDLNQNQKVTADRPI